MRLYIGGAHQGKTAYYLENEVNMPPILLDGANLSVTENLSELVRQRRNGYPDSSDLPRETNALCSMTQGLEDWSEEQRKTATEADGSDDTVHIAGLTDIPIVLTNLHTYVRRALEEGIDPTENVRVFSMEFPNADFISNEIGSGVVPIDPEERRWREVTGRLLQELAARSETVTRILAGLPQRIRK